MSKSKTHTVPNQILGGRLHIAGQSVGVALVYRGRELLAVYPATWCNHRMPTVREVQADAHWCKPSAT